jgi:hypothetical protein
MATVCRMSYFQLSHSKQVNVDLQRQKIIEKMQIFTRYDWMQQQSFCHGRKSNLKLMERLTKRGVCFMLNGQQDLVRADM